MKLIAIILAVAALAACGKKAEVGTEASGVYGLTADERSAAEINAKQYFEKQWIDADNQRGGFVSCRPTDSNANGMVSCFGKVPVAGGGYKDVKMYCGYKANIVGCSDEDTVAK